MQEISIKKIYDEVPEDIFDMSNMVIFKEIEKKTMGMFKLCSVFGHRSAELSKAFGLRNLCYSNAFREAFFLLKAKNTPSKICVFFSPSKERPAHQAEPAALEGDKMAAVIQNFVQSSF